MNNKDDIEVLDDFEVSNNLTDPINHNDSDLKSGTSSHDSTDEAKEQKTEQNENPVVEMINNKTTMKLIAILLIVLFIAVFFMPKFFQLIGNI